MNTIIMLLLNVAGMLGLTVLIIVAMIAVLISTTIFCATIYQIILLIEEKIFEERNK